MSERELQIGALRVSIRIESYEGKNNHGYDNWETLATLAVGIDTNPGMDRERAPTAGASLIPRKRDFGRKS